METLKIRQALRDEQINIFMMTEGISAYPKFAQVFLCKNKVMPNKQKGVYYLLDSKKSSPAFEMSDFGNSIAEQLNAPQLKYVARVDCHLKIYISKDIFADLNSDYFPVWKPEAPYSYFGGLDMGYLVIFRVYEINDSVDTSLLVKGRSGRNPVFGLYDSDGNQKELTISIKAPVLKDDEFLIIKQDIIHSLESNGALIQIIN